MGFNELVKQLEPGISPLENFSGLFTDIDDKIDVTNSLLRLLLLKGIVSPAVYTEMVSKVLGKTIKENEVSSNVKNIVINQPITGIPSGNVESDIRDSLSALSLKYVDKKTIDKTVLNLQLDLIGEFYPDALYVMVRADSANTGIIYWGTDTLTSGYGFPIKSGESYTLRIIPADLFLLANTTGQLLYIALFAEAGK